MTAATDTIWPALLDQSAFPGGKSEFRTLVASYDRDGDGSLCLLTMWGDELNPNSHWYQVGVDILGSPTQQFFLRDNTANGST